MEQISTRGATAWGPTLLHSDNEQLKSFESAQDLANQIRLSESYKAAVRASNLPAGKYLCPLAAEYISGQVLPFVSSQPIIIDLAVQIGLMSRVGTQKQ